MALLQLTKNGLYCEQADVYIDPWRKVDRALITHGHADHSRWGHKAYLCTHSAKPVIRHRLGAKMKIQSIEFGQKMNMNGVSFSFHPAGHIVGSAQIRVEYKGEVWVASGDYKTEYDGISEAFELVKCNTYITESTFGLPVYKWQPQKEVFEDIHNWWRQNQRDGKVTILTAYSLGKAQRIIANLDPEVGPIFTHGAVEDINEIIREQGFYLPPTTRVNKTQKKGDFKNGIVITPASGLGTAWVKKFEPKSVGAASGWMAVRGARRRRSVDRGFVLSDHVDWESLNAVIEGTGAEQVLVTHGYSDIYSKYLREKGLKSQVLETQFEGEQQEEEEVEEIIGENEKKEKE